MPHTVYKLASILFLKDRTWTFQAQGQAHGANSYLRTRQIAEAFTPDRFSYYTE